MKEIKKFFDTNRLNKGYGKRPIYKQTDSGNIVGKKYPHGLPPLDVMVQYEEISPGITDKILKMAEKEQSYRHSADLLANQKRTKAFDYGRLAAIALVGIVAMTVIILALYGHYMVASVFSLSAFGSIGFASVRDQRGKYGKNHFQQKN